MTHEEENAPVRVRASSVAAARIGITARARLRFPVEQRWRDRAIVVEGCRRVVLGIFFELYVEDVGSPLVAVEDTGLGTHELRWGLGASGLVLLATELEKPCADLIAAVAGVDAERQVLKRERRAARAIIEELQQFDDLVAKIRQ